MATTTANGTAKMACKWFEAAPVAELRCLHCGEVDTLKISVPTGALECESCGEETTHEEIEAAVAGWRKLARMLAAYAAAADDE